MRGVTSTITALAREARASGKGMWPFPLDKIEELAEHLQKLDRVVITAEVVSETYGTADYGVATEREAVAHLRAALREVHRE